jgi:hypothetical protein
MGPLPRSARDKIVRVTAFLLVGFAVLLQLNVILFPLNVFRYNKGQKLLSLLNRQRLKSIATHATPLNRWTRVNKTLTTSCLVVYVTRGRMKINTRLA